MPAILEYIPYRKNDATAVRDAGIHPYFAGHGYASVRVDLRGSGDSEGILEDEYLPREQEDGVEVIRWLAAQPWCTGAVGMIGKSWGGFNALQIAAHAPPELQAVISVCSTDDRYADDVHYLGGCVFGAYMLSWASTMLAFNARPPDPAVVGERWRELWLERLEQTPPFVEAWLSHQRRDEFWKQGSVCEDYGAIRCPVYMVGGWADGYSNAILRFLAGYEGPAEGPDRPVGTPLSRTTGCPGRAIGFLQECAALVGPVAEGDGDRDHGGADAPGLDARPGPAAPELRGAAGPLGGRARLASAELRDAQARAHPRRARATSPATPSSSRSRGSDAHGLESGTWVAWGLGRRLRARPAGGGRPLALLHVGAARRAPRAARASRRWPLTLASDRPCALVAARLCDVAPDGASTLVTTGVLNLTHRESHEHPAALVPGSPVEVTLRAEGDRVRLPAGAPHPPRPLPHLLAVGLALARARHPDRQHGGRVRAPAPDPAAAPGGRPARSLRGAPRAPRRSRSRSPSPATPRGRFGTTSPPAGGSSPPTCVYFGSVRIVGDGLELRERGRDTFAIVEGDPLSAEARSDWSTAVGRGDWRTRVETTSTMTADAEAFRVTNAARRLRGRGADLRQDLALLGAARPRLMRWPSSVRANRRPQLEHFSPGRRTGAGESTVGVTRRTRLGAGFAARFHHEGNRRVHCVSVHLSSGAGRRDNQGSPSSAPGKEREIESVRSLEPTPPSGRGHRHRRRHGFRAPGSGRADERRSLERCRQPHAPGRRSRDPRGLHPGGCQRHHHEHVRGGQDAAHESRVRRSGRRSEPAGRRGRPRGAGPRRRWLGRDRGLDVARRRRRRHRCEVAPASTATSCSTATASRRPRSPRRVST